MGIRDALSRKAFRTFALQINGCVLVFVKVFCRIGVGLSFFADGNLARSPPLLALWPDRGGPGGR